ncbi:mucoidy inhibitor MuiA family protein [Nocardia sp. 2]|uniref:Mucoidy inhibitor MuiA family protein n=1 Tax=Nocardia acididurans TaxID=2802282 RepID=A0ABS1MEM4_9NOCA|nr:mucoidy inhibitor MuiA family protein [Nocardia acididurans]MBL1078741.1 mucoidy inhibitor MuiA family protein [Nocardia acididurans]
MTTLDTSITAVTVYPDRARVTRSGTAELTAGEHRIRVAPLPFGLVHDSVRVAGHGELTVLGVDVVTERHTESHDEEVTELEARNRELADALAELGDADRAADARIVFLERLARRSAEALAKAGEERVTAFTESLDSQYANVHTARREREWLRQEHIREQQAIARRLADLRGKTRADVLAVVVTVEATQNTDANLEVSYMVPAASWHSSYDLRLTDDALALRWFGLVRQHTGEDWPECRLQLSTARPAQGLEVPELAPWFVSAEAPRPKARARRSVAGAYGAAAERSEDTADFAMDAMRAMPAPAAMAPAAAPPPVRESVAAVEQGATAATYTPLRPIAVASDGSAHRTVITALDLEVHLDHVTAPVRSPEAVLRATAKNNSEHTLPAGRASLFHEAEFVGATDLDIWAPGEERELALGVDDRIRVERELVRRNASKATLGSNRRTELEYTITVSNHGKRPADVTVLDRLPVARDAAITVKETTAKPDPAERDEMGIVTWKAHLDPQAEAVITFGYRVEAAKGVTIHGLHD